MDEVEWDILIRNIARGECMPIIGTDACCRSQPTILGLAESWAAQFHYPLADEDDLSHVAQFLAVARNPMWPKDLLQSYYEGLPAHDCNDPNETHNILARLPLPVYITTNYDSCMIEALKFNQKSPEWEICRWNQALTSERSLLDTFSPTHKKPLVYYMHGHFSLKQSLVLTEDDYLNFLVNTALETYKLPALIRGNLSRCSLLFIGYRMTDWSFRVWLHLLNRVMSMRSTSVTVVLPPNLTSLNAEPAAAQTYLKSYLEKNSLTVYWGETENFMAELAKRWSAFDKSRIVAPPAQVEVDLSILRDKLTAHFSNADLESLCMDIASALRQDGIEVKLDLEIVGGVGKEEIVVNLLEYLKNRDLLPYLFGALNKKRPGFLDQQ